MSEKNQDGSAADSNAGSVPPDTKPEDKKETVSYDTHSKLLGQRKKDQEKFKTVEDELKQLKEEKRIKEDADLEKQGEYQKLLEAERKRTLELTASNAQKDKVLTNGIKLQAFVDKLPGKVAKHDYLQFANLDNIVIDPDTNRVDELTLTEVVNGFVKEHSGLMELGGKKLPADNASGGGGVKLSYDDWLKLPTAKEKKARYHEVFPQE